MTGFIHAGTSVEQILAKALRADDTVADAAASHDPAGHLTAQVVPDPRHAPELHRAATLEAAGQPAGLDWHEPADDLRVAGVNRTESDFLYREIFTDNAYLRHGIALPGGAVVVDVGANIGMFTLYAARHSPGARVIAVEPVAELATAAALNAELHGVDATVLTCALGAAPGGSELTYYPNNSVMSGRYARADEDLAVLRGYLLTGEGSEAGRQLDRLAADRMRAERRSCEVRTLSAIAAEAGLTTIDLLKIDAEKAEADVLAGIEEPLWDRIQQIVVEVHDLDGRLAQVTELLRAKGFDVTCDRDPRLVLTPCHNVYARRPGARAAAPPAPGNHRPVTVRSLGRRLRDHLARHAPGLPLPDRFTLVAALPSPAATAPLPRPSAATLPAGSRTAVLADVWTGIFGPGSDRPDADFFDLGGDSLTAVRLLARLEERLGEEALAPDLIFTSGTFGALAAAVEETGR